MRAVCGERSRLEARPGMLQSWAGKAGGLHPAGAKAHGSHHSYKLGVRPAAYLLALVPRLILRLLASSRAALQRRAMLRFLIPKPAATPQAAPELSSAAPEPLAEDGSIVLDADTQRRPTLPKRAREPCDALDGTVESRHTATRVHPFASESVKVLPMTVDSPRSSKGPGGGEVSGVAPSKEEEKEEEEEEEEEEEQVSGVGVVVTTM